MADASIFYEDESFKTRAPEERVSSILSTLDPEILGSGSYSVSFVTPETMQSENRDYRGIDSVTDILTFAMEDGDEPFFTPDEDEKEWGDILICLDRMDENAKDFGVSSEEELARLLVHGLLHLSGMDHKTNDFETEEMLVRQESLLKKYNLC